MVELIRYQKTLYSHGEKKEVFFLRMDPSARLDFDKMCNLIAERTTLTAYEVEFVLSELHDVLIENIEIGRGIELGRLGSIEPSVKATAVDSLEELNLKTLKKATLVYKPSISLKKALKNLKYKILK
jgi:predicted histone-like DNA-binding protein